MKKHPELLSTAVQIRELAKVLEKAPVIAFDTEFIREQTFYPLVELIQVATEDESWLVDAKVFKKGFPSGPPVPGQPLPYDTAIDPLFEVFRNPKILKILHAAQGDQECLFTSFGALASPVLDTSVAASLCGYGDGVGLGKLLKSVLDVTIEKGHARTNWSIRPLPDELIRYAHADVEFLVKLGLTLLEKLEKMGRKEWAMEASSKWSEPALYESDIEHQAGKLARGAHLDKRGHAALVELLKWREERVRHLNLPRRWVADDAVLIDLARVRPKDIQHLSAFRGLNKGEIKNGGEAILSALERAKGAELAPAPSRGPSVVPSTEESQALDLLKCYLGILADHHRIALKHLSTVSQLLPLVRQNITCADDLVKMGVLNAHAAKLVGQEIVDFMCGRKALSVSRDEHGLQVKVVETQT